MNSRRKDQPADPTSDPPMTIIELADRISKLARGALAAAGIEPTVVERVADELDIAPLRDKS